MLRIVTILRNVGISCILLSSATYAFAGETITVSLKSGRRFTAKVDDRSDNANLWLRFGNDSAYLLRRIAWNRVEHAWHAGQRISASDLKSSVETLKKDPPTDLETSVSIISPPDLEEPGISKSEEPAAVPFIDNPFIDNAATDSRAEPSHSKVSSLDFDAFASNWDSDVENDGLILRIYPLDSEGRLTPVDGTLEIELIASSNRFFNSAPSSRGRTTGVIASWSQRLSSSDISQGGTLFRLPFQAIHPEFDQAISSYALVHVRLAVPGEGVFEASRDLIRIRPFAPLRDEMQRNSGTRFSPRELTGRGRR